MQIPKPYVIEDAVKPDPKISDKIKAQPLGRFGRESIPSPGGTNERTFPQDETVRSKMPKEGKLGQFKKHMECSGSHQNLKLDSTETLLGQRPIVYKTFQKIQVYTPHYLRKMIVC